MQLDSWVDTLIGRLRVMAPLQGEEGGVLGMMGTEGHCFQQREGALDLQKQQCPWGGGLVEAPPSFSSTVILPGDPQSLRKP